MKDLIELLHRDGNTLVVANGEVCAFQGRGISDLYRLLRYDAGFLQGASVADKVVGKGAAALMILGGVSELHADLISEPALTLLWTSRIRVSYGEKVPQIQDRTKTGISFLGDQVSGEVENMISLQSYIGTLGGMTMMFGIVFEIPVVC